MRWIGLSFHTTRRRSNKPLNAQHHSERKLWEPSREQRVVPMDCRCWNNVSGWWSRTEVNASARTSWTGYCSSEKNVTMVWIKESGMNSHCCNFTKLAKRLASENCQIHSSLGVHSGEAAKRQIVDEICLAIVVSFCMRVERTWMASLMTGNWSWLSEASIKQSLQTRMKSR